MRKELKKSVLCIFQTPGRVSVNLTFINFEDKQAQSGRVAFLLWSVRADSRHRDLGNLRPLVLSVEALGLGLDLSLPGFGLVADCSIYMWFMGLNCWWCCTVHSNYYNTFLLILVLLAFYLSQDVQFCSVICSQLRLHLVWELRNWSCRLLSEDTDQYFKYSFYKAILFYTSSVTWESDPEETVREYSINSTWKGCLPLVRDRVVSFHHLVLGSFPRFNCLDYAILFRHVQQQLVEDSCGYDVCSLNMKN